LLKNTLTTCPVCDSENIKKEMIDKTFEYSGKTFTIPNFIVYKCGECEESFPDKQQSKELEPTIRDFQRIVGQ